MPDLRSVWDNLAGDAPLVSGGVSGGVVGSRQEYLDAAEEVASLTLPDLKPRGVKLDVQPYSSLPGRSVRGLASALMSILFPQHLEWFEYQAAPSMEPALRANPEVRAELDSAFDLRRDSIKKFIDQKQVKAKLGRLIRRILVEGQAGVQILADKIRIHPLRSIGIKRHSGDLLYWVIKEMRPPDPRKLTREGAPPESYVYTMVDRVNNEVSQQIDDGTAETVKGKDGGDVRQYLLPVTEFPDNEDYVYGFAWHFKGLFNEIEALSSGLGEATANAAWAILLIAAVANVTPEEVRAQWRSGSAVVANKEHFSWLTSGVKLSDWQFIGAILNDLRNDLRETFLDEEPLATPDVTATAILRRAERFNQQTADLLPSLEVTLQRPLIDGIEAAQGMAPFSAAGIADDVQVAVVSGSSALQQDMRSMRAIQKIQVVQTMDPTIRVDGIKLLEELARGDGFNYERVVDRPEVPDVLPEGGDVTAANAPGTVRQTAGGPQPTLDGEGERRRSEQRIPPAAA